MIRSIAVRERRGPSRLIRLASLALALVACAATMVATSSIGLADDEHHRVTARDFRFGGMPERSDLGAFKFTFVNKTADSPHLIEFIKISPEAAGDATLKNAIAAADRRDFCPSGCYYSKDAGGAFADPSATVQGSVNLQPGKYAYLCFITDREGTPHYDLGMAGLISVNDRD